MIFQKLKVIVFVVIFLIVSMVGFFNIISAKAWTHEENNFDDDPTQYACGGPLYPCLYWQQPTNRSITLNVSLDSSLNLGYYDFSSVTRNAMLQYNSINAYNPFLSDCSSSSGCVNGTVCVKMGDLGVPPK